MKIFKHIVFVGIGLMMLCLLFVLVIHKNTKTLEKIRSTVAVSRDKAKDSKSIASIKFISTSIMLFEDEKNRIPLNMAELNSYSPIPEFASSAVSYIASTTKSFDYILCAPYTSDTLNVKNTDSMQWYLSSGSICLHSK